MSESSEVRSGLFVVIALAILGLGSLWIVGSNPFGGDRVSYQVLMKSAGGVRRGDQVRLAGVTAGRVEEVRLAVGAQWPVTFRVGLDKDLRLTDGATARFASDGLLGSGYLEIVTGPADAERLPPGGRILGDSGGSLSDVLAGLGGMTEKVEKLLDEASGLVQSASSELGPTLDRVRTLLSDENLEAASGMLQSLRRTSREMEDRLPPLLERLDAVVAETGVGAHEIPLLAEDVRALVADLRQAVGEDGQRLAEVLVAAENALVAAGGAFGVLGDRDRDIQTALQDLRETSAHLKAFSQAVRSRPSRLLRTPRTPDRKPGAGIER